MGTVQEKTSDSENQYWKRNLWVAVFGSVTTLISMTLLVPFLPFFVEELGAKSQPEVIKWSGIAFSATYMSSAICAPLWGYVSDRYGRKLMLVRASLGMGISMSLIGFSQNVYELAGLRLLAGALGGYGAASNVMVAAQTPKAHSGWALGVLSSGIMAGNLVGPLIGGTLPPLMGIRNTFFLSGGLIFLTFFATLFLVREEYVPPTRVKLRFRDGWRDVLDKTTVVVMLLTVFLLMVANLSIEPIITVYLIGVAHPEHVTFMSGLAMSASALGSILSAAIVGRYADRVGHWKVMIACFLICALLLLPQAFINNAWELVVLRFLMGLGLGGIIPGAVSIIRHNAPGRMTGQIVGLSMSAQFLGGVVGPLAGAFVGGYVGLRAVFISTSVLMAAGALMNWFVYSRTRKVVGIRRS